MTLELKSEITMPDVKWTKTYNLRVDDRYFRVFISEHDSNGGFNASCLWYDRGRIMKAPGQPGFFSFKLEQRHASTEGEALAQIEEWVKTSFGNDYQLALDASGE